MIPREWFDDASERIAPHIKHTPVTFDSKLNCYFKWENKQVTGSFKIRGAINKVVSLLPWEQAQGLVTASAGNHGQGVAMAGKQVSAPVVIFASEHASPVKVEAMKKLGGDVRFVNGGYGLAEKTAIEYAETHGKTFISAYNDGQVIAGQGTLGMEILQEIDNSPELTWIVPLGGGGLISGIGAVLRSSGWKNRLIGIQPEASPFTHALFHTGSQVGIRDLPTLAEGLSGPMQPGSVTLPLLKATVDEVLTVSEEEIAAAISFAWKEYQEVIEGSAATALAAVLFNKVKAPAVIVVTGGNIQASVHQEICQTYGA